jgi:hypothetical protein
LLEIGHQVSVTAPFRLPADATRLLAHNRFDVDGLELLYHRIREQSPGLIQSN